MLLENAYNQNQKNKESGWRTSIQRDSIFENENKSKY